jgi:hypothetical protein
MLLESAPNQFQLCFRSLVHRGRSFVFPCDPRGHVDLDRLSERARLNYLFARAMVGRELAAPAVESSATTDSNVSPVATSFSTPSA